MLTALAIAFGLACLATAYAFSRASAAQSSANGEAQARRVVEADLLATRLQLTVARSTITARDDSLTRQALRVAEVERENAALRMDLQRRETAAEEVDRVGAA